MDFSMDSKVCLKFFNNYYCNETLFSFMLVSQKLGKVCDDWEKENGTVILSSFWQVIAWGMLLFCKRLPCFQVWLMEILTWRLTFCNNVCKHSPRSEPALWLLCCMCTVILILLSCLCWNCLRFALIQHFWEGKLFNVIGRQYSEIWDF